MGDWYEIGISVGIGVAAGIAFAGVFAGLRFGFATTLLGALVAGVAAGFLANGWAGAAAGAGGAMIGAVSAAAIVRGANRRGATLAGTALLLLGAALVVGLLALIPAVGYLEAVALPLVAARRARSDPERYAGLRSLAK